MFLDLNLLFHALDLFATSNISRFLSNNIHLICFLPVRDHWLLLPNVRDLENIFIYFVCTFAVVALGVEVGRVAKMVLATLSRLEAKCWSDFNKEAFMKTFLKESKPCAEVIVDDDLLGIVE